MWPCKLSDTEPLLSHTRSLHPSLHPWVCGSFQPDPLPLLSSLSAPPSLWPLQRAPRAPGFGGRVTGEEQGAACLCRSSAARRPSPIRQGTAEETREALSPPSLSSRRVCHLKPNEANICQRRSPPVTPVARQVCALALLPRRPPKPGVPCLKAHRRPPPGSCGAFVRSGGNSRRGRGMGARR